MMCFTWVNSVSLNFKFHYFPGVDGWVREIGNKAKLSPAGAGAGTELGKIDIDVSIQII